MLDTGKLDRITTFPALIDYLRDELDWPIEEFSLDDLTFEWDPKEFGLSADGASGQIEIKQLRPLEAESWGIFFLSLPHKKLPVTVFRRILGSLAPKKRASANPADRAVWNKNDLLFIAAHGAGDARGLAFAHFHENNEHGDLPTLNVLGWDGADTIRRLSDTHRTLKDKLHWRDRGEGVDAWRTRWNSAFKERPGEVIATSKALAKELARLAREIRRRANELLAEENDKGPLRTLHKAFKEALIHDLKFDDFADMYAQTIAYGLLAARISRESGALVADNAADLAPPTNPFLKELLQTFLSVGGRKGGMDFDELGVNDVVEMLRRADIHAVLLDFDTKNPSEDPVIHFYELFLKEYDAKKRMQRGVFYTPRPVVSFIVRSVDEVLRTEFELKDGLASTSTWRDVIAAKPEINLPTGTKETDPFVRILDPATGTGTFLVEVVDLIYGRLIEKWRRAGKGEAEIEAMWNDYVPDHLLPRLYGFELMMAPYAIAHMKLGLKLAETGYHFRSDERAHIYLTNALEPAHDFDMQLAFMSEALAHEAQAANTAKEVRFAVVIGNPPYSGISKNMFPWIDGLLKGKTPDPQFRKSYYEIDGRPLREKKIWLQDDYVKFIRLGQFYVDRSGCGILSYITNSGYLDNPTFRGMRWQLLRTFNESSFVDLHGSTKKRVGSGEAADQNVFDIEQGVAVCLMRSLEAISQRNRIFHGGLKGDRNLKFGVLASTTAQSLATIDVRPTEPFFFFQPPTQASNPEYVHFPQITEIMPATVNGIVTARDHLAVGLDNEVIKSRIADLTSAEDSDIALRNRYWPGKSDDKYPPGDTRGWKLPKAREALRKLPSPHTHIHDVDYRPFDTRQIFYHSSLVDWGRWDMMSHMINGDNISLCTTRQLAGLPWHHALVGSHIQDDCYVSNRTRERGYLFPLWLVPDGTGSKTVNIAPAIIREISHLFEWSEHNDRGQGDLERSFGPRDVFDWIYAVLHSPGYRSRYADYLKSDFPRVPLPGSKGIFQDLVPLGRKLVALHLLDPNGAQELMDPQSVRFAGHGDARVESGPEWSAAGGGRATISNHRWFEGVPERVWNFQIGGYQPAQKWLKDRAAKGGKKRSPGRVLTTDDQLHYRRMVIAMNRTIDLMADIDQLIEKRGGWPSAFEAPSS